MRIKRRIALRWTWIVGLCGAHSFFWGAMTHGNVLAMLLALATVVITYTLIESSARFERLKTDSPALQAALKQGIKLRLWFVALIAASYAISLLNTAFKNAMGWITELTNIPAVIELSVGLVAVAIHQGITSIDYNQFQSTQSRELFSSASMFAATYAITLITAFLHAIILVILCALTYLAAWVRCKWQSAR